jgi:hypothetical protein
MFKSNISNIIKKKLITLLHNYVLDKDDLKLLNKLFT